MIRLLQFLALLLLVRYLVKAVARWLMERGTERQRVGSSESGGKPVYRGQMVRDPVCGLFLPRESAVEDRTTGETQHFCSDECREAFRKERANGVPGVTVR